MSNPEYEYRCHNIFTGDEFVVAVMWGEEPETDKYETYGFKTMEEVRAFVFGMEATEGWTAFQGHVIPKGDKQALQAWENQLAHYFENWTSYPDSMVLGLNRCPECEGSNLNEEATHCFDCERRDYE